MARRLRIGRSMQSRFRHTSAGYSLTELLVVLAIIGVLSLITVPAFMNFQNANTFKSSLRDFTSDLRWARQYAISHTVDVRFDLDAPGNSQTSKTYTCLQSADYGTTWTTLSIPGGTANVKRLSGPVWFQTTTQFPLVAGKPSLVYHPSGAITLNAGSTSATVVLRSIWTKIASDTYTITFSPSGGLSSAGSHS